MKEVDCNLLFAAVDLALSREAGKRVKAAKTGFDNTDLDYSHFAGTYYDINCGHGWCSVVDPRLRYLKKTGKKDENGWDETDDMYANHPLRNIVLASEYNLLKFLNQEFSGIISKEITAEMHKCPTSHISFDTFRDVLYGKDKEPELSQYSPNEEEIRNLK